MLGRTFTGLVAHSTALWLIIRLATFLLYSIALWLIIRLVTFLLYVITAELYGVQY